MKELSKHNLVALIGLILFLLIIYLIGYFTPRENFNQFISLYFAAFIIFYGLWLNKQGWNFRLFLGIAIAARLILLFAVPQLSNDFYRFIWDGEMLVSGINPYAHIPNDLISQQPFYADLYMRTLWRGMGELSQSHYSCYPVLNQLLFALPAYLFDSIQANVIFYKLMLIAADIGIVIVGKKILDFLKKPAHLIWLFALNPFVILEFSGNLHFEGVMILFILIGFYALLKNNWLFASFGFAMAIQIKLVPLIILPFMLKKLKWQAALGFLAATLFLVIALFLTLMNASFFNNMMASINLYFQTFEFNASVFNLFREYSLSSLGYDNIAKDGPLLSKISTTLILLMALFRSYLVPRDLFTSALFALAIYYVFATTVHPWYVSMLLIVSIFTHYKFALVWSAMVMLSYHAYAHPYFVENGSLIFLEYFLVFSVAVYEIVKHTKWINFGIQFKAFFGK